MKRRRRYGEKYSDLPYPEGFKSKMMALFLDDEKLEEALDGGWDAVRMWFDELCSVGPAMSADTILELVERGEDDMLRGCCEAMIQRRKELKALSDEWQRIVFLDDQSCDPWEEE